MTGRRFPATVLMASLLLVMGAVAGVAQRGGPPPGGAPGGGRAGGPNAPEQKVLARFDTDGDKRLNRVERDAARAFLATSGAGRGGGRAGGRGGAQGPAPAGERIDPSAVPSYTTPLYDDATLRTLFLTFEYADWEDELAAFNNTDVEVPATLTVDGTTYEDVGVHFRGASSFFSVSPTYKRSLNLSIDWINAGNALLGYRTLNLLNSNGDPTFMRAALYTRIAREYIPIPKVNFVRVVINGENWGVYASAQQFNKEFARDFFGTTEGARWKVPGSPNGRAGLEYLGEDHAAYKTLYEIKSKDAPASWDALVKLTRVLNQTATENLVRELSPILNIDGALRFLALENALVNSDGYWVRSSDYNIYQDTAGVFHIVPHDVNETFSSGGGRGGGAGAAPGGPPPDAGRAGRGGALPPPGGAQPPAPQPGRGGGPGGGVNLDPLAGTSDPTKPLLSRLLAVPELRARYLGYVREIAEKWLDWRNIDPIVSQYRSLIAAEVERDTKKLDSFQAFNDGIAGTQPGRMSLKGFADARRAFLLSHPALVR